jgi:hypothetical protein
MERTSLRVAAPRRKRADRQTGVRNCEPPVQEGICSLDARPGAGGRHRRLHEDRRGGGATDAALAQLIDDLALIGLDPRWRASVHSPSWSRRRSRSSRAATPPPPQDGRRTAWLCDRVEALGGRLTLASAAGSGTTVCARLPVATQRPAMITPGA